MMEQMLLGLVAHRAGKKIEYDPETGRVTNFNEANDYLKRSIAPAGRSTDRFTRQPGPPSGLHPTVH